MKILIAIILILSAVSCGKKRNKTNNSVASTSQGAYLECSYVQRRLQCLDYVDNKPIPPRFFYYRQCYDNYRACLASHGL